MRKSKKKLENLIPQAEQAADAIVTPATEEAAPEVPAQESAPKRLRRKKLDKAEVSVRKRARKEEKELPGNTEEAIILQYGGQELDIAQLKERVIATYVEAGHRRGRISKLNLYIKPEDQKVYYVINDKNSGSIDF